MAYTEEQLKAVFNKTTAIAVFVAAPKDQSSNSAVTKNETTLRVGTWNG